MRTIDLYWAHTKNYTNLAKVGFVLRLWKHSASSGEFEKFSTFLKYSVMEELLFYFRDCAPAI